MKKNIIFSRCLLGFGLVLSVLLSSCSTPRNIAYFQDMPIGKTVSNVMPLDIRLRPQDKISILVSTRDPALSGLFSLYNNNSVLNGSGTNNTNNMRPSEYTVNSDGCIDFPVLGLIEVYGKSREELQKFIKDELIRRNLVKDPIITVEFVNLGINVIGAMGHVGRIDIDRDQFTLLDAISRCGDLDLTGQRENIRVIRETAPNRRIAYEVNLCSAEDLYNSPVYYLQQNDVIYIEPNNKVKRTSTEYGSRMVNYTFWTGLLTTALSLIALFK